jgi:hypothetical protein
VDPDPGLAEGMPRACAAAAKAVAKRCIVLRAAQRAFAVVGLGHRGREHDCHGVADDAVEGALVLEGDPDHVVQVVVEQGHGLGRVELLHQGGETGQVGEQEAALAPGTAEFQLGRVAYQVLDQVGRDVA